MILDFYLISRGPKHSMVQSFSKKGSWCIKFRPFDQLLKSRLSFYKIILSNMNIIYRGKSSCMMISKVKISKHSIKMTFFIYSDLTRKYIPLYGRNQLQTNQIPQKISKEASSPAQNPLIYDSITKDSL